MGPEEHFRSNIFAASLWTFELFVLLMKFLWQQRQIILSVDKTAKNVSSSKLRKNLFQKKKSYCSIIFNVSSEVFFVFSEKLPAWLSKLQPTYLSKILRLNNFEKLHKVSIFLWVWDLKKIRAFSQKDIFTVSTTGYRASRGIIWEWVIFISKFFILSGIIFGDWAISVSFCKILLFSCVRTPIYVRGQKKLGNNIKNCYSFVFRLWAEKNLNFQQNSKAWFSKLYPTCPEEQFRNFSEATITVWKFGSFNGKIGFLANFFTQGCGRRISRVHCKILRKSW